jgi:hypothetical protein
VVNSRRLLTVGHLVRDRITSRVTMWRSSSKVAEVFSSRSRHRTTFLGSRLMTNITWAGATICTPEESRDVQIIGVEEW